MTTLLEPIRPELTHVARRPHLEWLDGLRGLAAAAVVLHHLHFALDLPFLVPRGYLAVDLFFLLSGYVLTYAYAGRLGAMSGSDFARLRLVRLLPMIVLGTLGGALLALVRFRGHEPAAADLLVATILGSLALPMLFHTSLLYEAFPINGPVWSLFFELLASAVLFLAARRGALRPWSAALTLAGALALVPIALLHRDISVGYLPPNWAGGFARVGFSFFAGVLLRIARPALPAVPVAVALALCLGPFLVPQSLNLHGLVDLVAVFALFPIGVASLAQAQPAGRWIDACRLSGEASYPLYAIHYPIVLAVASSWRVQALATGARAGVAAAVTGGVVLLSLAASRLFDVPVRRRLGALGRRQPSRGIRRAPVPAPERARTGGRRRR